jgi:hypothetical protein
MKYLFDFYVNNGWPVTQSDIKRVPIGKPIYGLAYSVDDDDGRNRLRCEPVLGEVFYKYSDNCGPMYFATYKKGTTQRCKSGVVLASSRMYADTYEEAIEMYNDLVQQRIEKLKAMIAEAEDEKLTAPGLPTNHIEVYLFSDRKFCHVGHISADKFDREECFDLCNWVNWTDAKPENLHADIESCGHGVCFVNPNTGEFNMALSIGWLVGTKEDICRYAYEHRNYDAWL